MLARRTFRLASLVTLASLGACGRGPDVIAPPPDGSMSDASMDASAADGSTALDAASPPDAGGPPDSGVDAAAPNDGATHTDATGGTDAGPDASPHADSGTDSAAASDGGIDSGLTADATSPIDAAQQADGGSPTDSGTKPDSSLPSDASTGGDATAVADSGAHPDATLPGDAGDGGASACGACPSNYTCGSANNHPVCRAPSGVPMFSNVWVVPMENTSLSTLQSAIGGGHAPYISSLQANYASSSNYHGVAHPSLPNYIAMVSGGTQGIGCDCKAEQGQGTCNGAVCNTLLGSCTCTVTASTIADQIEGAGLTWMSYAEGMGTPCNAVDNATTSYAARHVPFLYFDEVQLDAGRCNSHVVDYSGWSPSSSATFNFLTPNLINDMHDPNLPLNATTVNIPHGDTWLGQQIPAILASSAYAKGGLIVVVWDEDDDSGAFAADAPIGLFVMSPFAKTAFVSSVHADHYSLLATIEDGLGLTRLGAAATATPLSDLFPAN